ncbi:collagen alpha-1(XXI) chain-like [Saccostrea echinata]|uniref:collagen alpha-1(XXI) chain-like n=1 Tax=Saccostrea echinata TaxID=191078 RepID=UPI002A82D9C3|nr:collagen alpha-1(XXI) chain-like [Saccostrea echinata]
MPTGGTFTHLALNYSYSNSFESRNGTSKAIVVLTYGKSHSQNETHKAADDLRSIGVEVYAVGVGSEFMYSDLQAIANDPDTDYIYHLDDFVYLCNVIPGIVHKLENTAVPISDSGCPEITTTTSPKINATTDETISTTTEESTSIADNTTVN